MSNSLSELKTSEWLLEQSIKQAEESLVIPPENNAQLPYMYDRLEEVRQAITDLKRGEGVSGIGPEKEATEYQPW